MLWRVRLALPDRPGTLAQLAHRCGEAGINIMGVQVFPGIDEVTDELVLDVPPGVSGDGLADIVEGAGATSVVAYRCTDGALLDQPTRHVQAARSILTEPARFPEIVAGLFDADSGVDGWIGQDDVMEMTVGDVAVQVRRATPFTATEHARGAALAELVSEVLLRAQDMRAVSPRRVGEGITPTYAVRELSVVALVDQVEVGRALLMDVVGPGLRRTSLNVKPDWRRRGIGTRLLVEAVRLARGLGDDELVLEAAADNPAVLPMVLGSGLRCRIRMQGSLLTVRVPVRDRETSRL